MSETQGTQNSSGEQAGKTFTQEEVNSIIGERLARQAEKYSDYDALKSKAAEYDKQQEASKTELQKAQEKSAKLQAELDGMKKAEAIRNIRGKVSKDTGVPVDLLSGEDEETCKTQAQAILKFAKGSKYPGVKEEKHETNHQSSTNNADDEAFREFAGQLFGRKG